MGFMYTSLFQDHFEDEDDEDIINENNQQEEILISDASGVDEIGIDTSEGILTELQEPEPEAKNGDYRNSELLTPEDPLHEFDSLILTDNINNGTLEPLAIVSEDLLTGDNTNIQNQSNATLNKEDDLLLH